MFPEVIALVNTASKAESATWIEGESSSETTALAVSKCFTSKVFCCYFRTSFVIFSCIIFKRLVLLLLFSVAFLIPTLYEFNPWLCHYLCVLGQMTHTLCLRLI